MNTVQNADPKNPSINQLPRKMALQRAYQTIGGSCQWPASAVTVSYTHLYHYRIAQLLQLAEHVYQFVRIAAMQADARFVKNIQAAH